MTSIIQHSSSIHNTFISTVDHLPCDIIRSLWLIQSCNISIAKHKEQLHRLLVQLKSNAQQDIESTLIEKICLINIQLSRLNDEAISESQALHNQLITHKISLSDEVDQLRNIASKSHDIAHESDESEKLRAQLIEHYKNNPLTSQREAQEEQDKISNIEENVPGTEKQGNGGIKLVLRLSSDKPKKSPKPIHKEKKKKNEIEQKMHKSALSSRTPGNKGPKPSTKKEISSQSSKEEVADETEENDEADDTSPYCFCRQPSFGDMIACDNEESCPNGEWFHYKCVGLLNRVEALKFTTGRQKWFCSEHCRNKVTNETNEKKRKKKRRRFR